MAGPHRITVLVIVEHDDTRALYVDTLLAAGYMVHGVESQDQAELVARATRFDIAVLDSPLDAVGLEVAERLAALRRRPRLLVMTSRSRNGAPLEWLFDAYLVKPCLPDALLEAVRSVRIVPPTTRDLLIVARHRVGIRDVLQRLGDTAANVEIRLDCRHGERRRRERRRASVPLGRLEKRRAERRALDVNHQLRKDGWAFIPAMHRAL
jgi:DNA-binding response OmpR family regulator